MFDCRRDIRTIRRKENMQVTPFVLLSSSLARQIMSRYEVINDVFYPQFSLALKEETAAETQDTEENAGKTPEILLNVNVDLELFQARIKEIEVREKREAEKEKTEAKKAAAEAEKAGTAAAETKKEAEKAKAEAAEANKEVEKEKKAAAEEKKEAKKQSASAKRILTEARLLARTAGILEHNRERKELGQSLRRRDLPTPAPIRLATRAGGEKNLSEKRYPAMMFAEVISGAQEAGVTFGGIRENGVPVPEYIETFEERNRILQLAEEEGNVPSLREGPGAELPENAGRILYGEKTVTETVPVPEGAVSLELSYREENRTPEGISGNSRPRENAGELTVSGKEENRVLRRVLDSLQNFFTGNKKQGSYRPATAQTGARPFPRGKETAGSAGSTEKQDQQAVAMQETAAVPETGMIPAQKTPVITAAGKSRTAEGGKKMPETGSSSPDLPASVVYRELPGEVWQEASVLRGEEADVSPGSLESSRLIERILTIFRNTGSSGKKVSSAERGSRAAKTSAKTAATEKTAAPAASAATQEMTTKTSGTGVAVKEGKTSKTAGKTVPVSGQKTAPGAEGYEELIYSKTSESEAAESSAGGITDGSDRKPAIMKETAAAKGAAAGSGEKGTALFSPADLSYTTPVAAFSREIDRAVREGGTGSRQPSDSGSIGPEELAAMIPAGRPKIESPATKPTVTYESPFYREMQQQMTLKGSGNGDPHRISAAPSPGKAPAQVRISEAEIRRSADRIYKIIKERIRLEQRSSGM